VGQKVSGLFLRRERVRRFPGWRNTNAGEREVQKALRKTLPQYQLHKDQELFDRVYGSMRHYY